MRRFVCLLFLLLMSVPFGLSVAGCGHKAAAVQYCPGFTNSGPVAGQVSKITLSPTLATTGLSLNYGQIGATLSATAVDCFGTAVSVSSYTYASTNTQIADINPTSGSVCGGTWNRNSGGGIANYSICSPAANVPTNFVAFVTATANGATSNAIPVYVHPIVASVVTGSPTPSASCSQNNGGVSLDPLGDASNCCTNTSTSTTTVIGAAPYTGGVCLSQGAPASTASSTLGVTPYSTGQLFARVYSGTPSAATNITCQVGHVGFALLNNTTAANIDNNGVITANQPGSALVTATVANASSGSSVGYYSTCPPQSITLAPVGQTGSTVNVNINNPLSFTTTVLDTAGFAVQSLPVEFNSTSPRIAPVTSSGVVTPAYPGTVNITASCQPGTCNTAPFSQIGYLGNGLPLTSNGITVNSVGTSSQVIYVGSTNSQYIVSEDFVTGALTAPIKLPYTPNSMVISQDGSTIYMGSTQALMSLSTGTNSVSLTNTALPGTVVGISPDGSTIALTDSTRGTITLVNPGSSTVVSTYGGVATQAQWTPDNLTVYITTTDGRLLTYSSVTGWQPTTADEVYTDVAVTVPSLGAYFAGTQTEGRSSCPSAIATTVNGTPTTTTTFSPLVDTLNVKTDRISATTDGVHIIGASAVQGSAGAAIQDILPVFPTQKVASTGATVPAACPIPPATPTPGYYTHSNFTVPLSRVTPSVITGVVPASNTSTVAVTYTGSGALLPLYVPAKSGAGTLRYVTLSGSATAPVAGVYSTDNSTFYAGTSGDNQVHVITIANGVGTDSSVIAPNLPDANNVTTVPNLIVQRPRKTTTQ